MTHIRPPASLQEYVQRLQKQKEIITVSTPVDPYLEIAEITRRVVQEGGKALLFTNVKGSSFPIATNLYGTQNRLNIAFGHDVQERIHTIVSFLTEHFPPSFSYVWEKKRDLMTLFRSLRVSKRRRWIQSPPSLEITQKSVNLDEIPLLTSWKEDGGPFITLPLVYTESPRKPHSKNLGMYRIQRFDKDTTGLHWQIGKGGGFHFYEAEEMGQNLPVSIFIGGPPALTLAAIAPLPENVPELLFASFLLQDPLKMTFIDGHPHAIPNEADFTLLGYAEASTRRLEGPFGDHFGYLSLAHEFPVFRCTKVFHRKDAIYPATVVGPPPQEDFYIGQFLQNILKPLFPVVMPAVKDLHTYPESGFHALAAIQIRERYEKEALSTCLRVLGEGQLALTKILIAIDNDEISLTDFKAVFQYLLERMRGEEDIIILSHTANDTLDYTGPKLHRGSKAIFLGTGSTPRRSLPKKIPENLPSIIETAALFCPGCLVISLQPGASPDELPLEKCLQDWPCVIITDDPKSTVSSQTNFLWHVFTRFEPGHDIFFSDIAIKRNMAGYSLPMIIDSRMKSSYPPVLQVDKDTEKLVSQRWKEYFPS